MMQSQPSTRTQVVAGGAAAAVIVAGVLAYVLTRPSGIVCNGTTDTTSAIQSAVNVGGTVNLPAGTCKLTGHIVVNKPVVIDGAGQTKTLLMQWSAVNVFQITAPGVTVENLTADTGTHNPGVPPVRKSPVPAVLFSNANNTTLLNVTAIAGTGFGLRLTGPNPCQNYQVTGAVVTNLTVDNTGTGGFSSLDVDCQKQFTLTNLTLNGGTLTPYQDFNGTITNVVYHKGKFGSACQPAIEVTGPSNTITITNVTTYNGKVTSHGTRFGNVLHLVVTGQILAGACK